MLSKCFPDKPSSDALPPMATYKNACLTASQHPCMLSRLVVSDSLQAHGGQPPGSFLLVDSASKNTGLGCHFFPQGPRDQTQVSLIAGGFFTSWATRKIQEFWSGYLSLLQQIFQTQELNYGLLHCRQILYQLSYQGSRTTLWCL